MGLADNGIAGDPAKQIGDPACRLALAPQATQFFDPFVCPIHGITYEI
jgi:hypothetical protein